jgi:sugar lactone lactonase YvrE
VSPAPCITAVAPLWSVPGGRIAIHGERLLSSPDSVPGIRVGEVDARVVRLSRSQIDVLVPDGVEGRVPVRVADVPGATAFVDVAAPLATGVHLVDNPVFDRRGTLYATFSGTRSQQSAVTIYKLQADRAREPFVTTIAHPTSLAFAADGALYVTDRFESTLYRVDAEGKVEPVASDLGVPCGLAFGTDGALYVGDRSGSIIRLDTKGLRTHVAALPPSVAAYHLAWGPDDHLYVSVPTLSTHDSLFRVSTEGAVEILPVVFGRPQGIAFDRQGRLYVCEALAGSSGIYRLDLRDVRPTKVVAAPAAIGLALDPAGGMVVASSEVLHHLAVAV